MYSMMTWRVFESLVRQYCKADYNDPKPLTFQQICNGRLMQVMGALDGLDDQRYRRSHILSLPGGTLYDSTIEDMTPAAKTIEQGTSAWPVDTIVTGIVRSGGNYSHFLARVVQKVNKVHTLEILSGTLVNKADIQDAYILSDVAFASPWDSQNLRLRMIRGVMDYVVDGGAGKERTWYRFTRFEVFRELEHDAGMDTEVGYYNMGGSFQFKAGITAETVAVPVLEFECAPSLYTPPTIDNRIELLPEHLRMLFDGVASMVLKVKGHPEPDDLRARLRDDQARFYNARREEVVRKAAQDSKINE